MSRGVLRPVEFTLVFGLATERLVRIFNSSRAGARFLLWLSFVIAKPCQPNASR
jgi:hypothetical protein